MLFSPFNPAQAAEYQAASGTYCHIFPDQPDKILSDAVAGQGEQFCYGPEFYRQGILLMLQQKKVLFLRPDIWQTAKVHKAYDWTYGKWMQRTIAKKCDSRLRTKWRVVAWGKFITLDGERFSAHDPGLEVELRCRVYLG